MESYRTIRLLVCISSVVHKSVYPAKYSQAFTGNLCSRGTVPLSLHQGNLEYKRAAIVLTISRPFQLGIGHTCFYLRYVFGPTSSSFRAKLMSNYLATHLGDHERNHQAF